MDKNINTPLVSVIMSAYNASNYIQEAINSVVGQTFSNWELIIIDDGSTDITAEIIARNIDKESRIKYYYQVNQKQSKARNFGISLALGTFIAILDADDIILPERFAKQVAFFENNKEIILCGSWFSIINSERVIKTPENHENIKLALLKGNCIAHSSVMIRKQSLNQFPNIYDVSKEPAEDYDLWVRLVLQGCLLYNLQEVLLDYRIHNTQLSNQQNLKQIESVLQIKHKLFSCLELNLLLDEKIILDKIINNGFCINYKDIPVFKKLQIKLLASNTSNLFEAIGFKKEIVDLEKLVIKRCFLNKQNYQPKIYFEYLKIKSSLIFKLTLFEEIKLFIKSFIFFKSKF